MRTACCSPEDRRKYTLLQGYVSLILVNKYCITGLLIF